MGLISDEEYNAIMAMSDEEANALEKEIDAKLSAALKKLNSSLSGREDVKAKVDAAINVATDRASKGEDVSPPHTSSPLHVQGQLDPAPSKAIS